MMAVAESSLTKQCDECGSLFYISAYLMDALCPACAHVLYGYAQCAHRFVKGRCGQCYWDGAESSYVQKIKAEKLKQKN